MRLARHALVPSFIAGILLIGGGCAAAPDPAAQAAEADTSSNGMTVHDGRYVIGGQDTFLTISAGGTLLDVAQGMRAFATNWTIDDYYEFKIQPFYSADECVGVPAPKMHGDDDWAPACFGVSFQLSNQMNPSSIRTSCTLKFDAAPSVAYLKCQDPPWGSWSGDDAGLKGSALTVVPRTDTTIGAIAPGLYSSSSAGNLIVDVLPPTVAGAPARIAILSPTSTGCFDRDGASQTYGEAAHLVCVRGGNCYYQFDHVDAKGRSVFLGAGTTHVYPWGTSPNFVTLSFEPPGAQPDYDPTASRGGIPANAWFLVPASAPHVCGVTCPAPPPPPDTPPPPPPNPCAGPGAPGWCFPGWEPPFGFESPLVLSLGAGDTTIAFAGKGVPFNLDGHGAQPLDWPLPRFPFLGLDRNGNGVIDDGTELFGTATAIKATGQTASDGFTALAQYDDNADQTIDRKDAIYGRLVLWFDANSDGICQSTELVGLQERGVAAIHLKAQATTATTATTTANAFLTSTSTFDEQYCSPAASMLIADVWFRTTP